MLGCLSMICCCLVSLPIFSLFLLLTSCFSSTLVFQNTIQKQLFIIPISQQVIFLSFALSLEMFSRFGHFLASWNSLSLIISSSCLLMSLWLCKQQYFYLSIILLALNFLNTLLICCYGSDQDQSNACSLTIPTCCLSSKRQQLYGGLLSFYNNGVSILHSIEAEIETTDLAFACHSKFCYIERRQSRSLLSFYVLLGIKVFRAGQIVRYFLTIKDQFLILDITTHLEMYFQLPFSSQQDFYGLLQVFSTVVKNYFLPPVPEFMVYYNTKLNKNKQLFNYIIEIAQLQKRTQLPYSFFSFNLKGISKIDVMKIQYRSKINLLLFLLLICYCPQIMAIYQQKSWFDMNFDHFFPFPTSLPFSPYFYPHYQILYHKQMNNKEKLEMEFDHVVCGGGLVGIVWALYLKRRSDSVAVFETYPDLRQETIPGGRSINLVLSQKAYDSLSQLGIQDQIIENTIPIKGQSFHCLNGQIINIPYGLTQQQRSFCIPRNKLSAILLDILENNNIPIFFQHTLFDGDLDSNQYFFKTRIYENELNIKVKAKHIYGTDGAGSKVREFLLQKMGSQANIQWYPADYKQLFLPMTQQTEDYYFDPQWVHIWPRGGQMIMGHANANKSFSLTIILPSEGPKSFSKIAREEEQQTKFFEQNYPDLASIIPNLYVQLSQNPVGYLGTIRCPKWHYKNKVVLLGDAAHTICPFLWQAVNVGFDDCLYLDKCIDSYGFTQKGFSQYQKLQKPKADAVTQITLGNFDNLSSNQNLEDYLKIKKMEKQLQKMYPQRIWSKYRMVFFSSLGYDQILEYIKREERLIFQSRELLKEMMSSPSRQKGKEMQELLKRYKI